MMCGCSSFPPLAALLRPTKDHAKVILAAIQEKLVDRLKLIDWIAMGNQLLEIEGPGGNVIKHLLDIAFARESRTGCPIGIVGIIAGANEHRFFGVHVSAVSIEETK